MTRILTLMMLAAALAFAQQPASGKSSKTSKASPAAKAAPAAASKKDGELPPGAVLVGEGTWRHTDADGKTWTYRRTPFGLIKMAGAPEQPAESNSSLRVVSVTDDEVEFESVTPFGKPRWKRAKSALTPEEKAVLDRHETAAPKAQAKDNS